MKKINYLMYAVIVFILHLGKTFKLSAQCTSTYYSENGYNSPLKGTPRVLLVFAFLLILFSSNSFTQSQTPAWLFPIMFKDYNGDRDTIYIGCDSNATIFNDTAYGEKWIQIDTTKFHAGIDIWQDSAIKIKIVPSAFLNDWAWGSFQFTFHKGRMPLTMYWYDTLFYNDSLPYPDLSPRPRARGNLACGGSICPTDTDIILTDMPDSLPFVPVFTYSDSIVFPGDSTQPGISVGGFFLRILPFDSWDQGGGITEPFEENEFYIFPNPAVDVVTIQTYRQVRYSYTIQNVLGQIMATNYSVFPSMIVNISDLPQGLYFVQLKGINFTVTRKFIKK